MMPKQRAPAFYYNSQSIVYGLSFEISLSHRSSICVTCVPLSLAG
jgi:hypothetical protein